jgi:hypothetical protein
MYADTVDCARPVLAWMWVTHTPTAIGSAIAPSSGKFCTGSRSHWSN